MDHVTRIRLQNPVTEIYRTLCVYERSTAIVVFTLSRAANICECCQSPAPIKRSSGDGYLEVHQLDRVSDGGVDAPTGSSL